MKNVVSVISCAALLAFVVACSSRGSHHTHYAGTYSPTYSSAPVVQEGPGAPPAAPRALAGKAYPTPQAAMEAVSQAAALHDQAKIEELFGPGATDVLWSGDDDADRADGLKVKSLIAEKLSFDEEPPERVTAEIGNVEWPFPFPLVKSADGWRFDLEAGKDELLSRRIGRNELRTIQTMYEYVDAQNEYFAKGRDGNPKAYAQKVRSTFGKHDGLYWESAEGEEQSPLGPFVADAQRTGYDAPGDEPQPFHGYYYKILTGQGAKATGGKHSYVDSKGLMTKGYAAIAWPAIYGNSGIKTFLVSNTGVTFEKDLGKDTAAIASAVTEYDPDKTWQPSLKPVLDDDDDDE